VPVTGFCVSRGNLNASGEIFWRKKKFSTFAPKAVHIGTFIGQFHTVFDILAQFFRCEHAFRLNQITGMKGGTIAVEHFDVDGSRGWFHAVGAGIAEKSCDSGANRRFL
jgi:hypothetical protein